MRQLNCVLKAFYENHKLFDVGFHSKLESLGLLLQPQPFLTLFDIQAVYTELIKFVLINLFIVLSFSALRPIYVKFICITGFFCT